MLNTPVNSVMKLLLPQNVDPSLDTRVKGYIEQITNAVQQLQNYTEQYLGVTQKISSQWSQLTAADTLLEHQLNRFYVKAVEAIAYGAMVNIYEISAGVSGIRNAKCTSAAYAAMGFCTTVGGIAAGAYGEVILLRGVCTAIGGMTPGVRYFLSPTAGLIQAGEPGTAGYIGQYIGLALAPAILLVDINMQFVQR